MNLKCFATILLGLLLTLPLSAGGKRKDEIKISFHIETLDQSHPKMVFNQFTAGKERLFRRVPEVILKDVSYFNPFPAKNGNGYGVLLKLKSNAKNRLAAVSSNSINRWLLAMVNGRAVDAVIIDRQIDDGELVIWEGISLADVEALDKSIPRLGNKKPSR